MGEFNVPLLGDLSNGAITVSSPECLGDVFTCSGGAFGGAAWPAANRAIFMPFQVLRKVTVFQVAWVNGGTVSGNLDVGIYDIAGGKIVGLGSTAQSGVSTIQFGNIADTDLAPGYYYMAMIADNTTGIYNRVSVAVAQQLQTMGVQQMATSIPLPATATFANPASAYFPELALLLNATA